MVIRTPAGPDGIAEAARRIRGDGVVVFPTETFYGLACDPRRGAAVETVFLLKGRPAERALPLVAGSRAQVALAAPGWNSTPGAAALAEAFWPGPLALLVVAGPGLAPGVASADGMVAVRWTSHPVAASLAVAVGFPIVATSANLSGERPHRSADAAARLAGVDQIELLVLDGGRTPGGRPSTVVDLRGGRLVVVRAGAIEERLLASTFAAASRAV